MDAAPELSAVAEPAIPETVRLNLARNSARDKTVELVLSDYRDHLDELADWVTDATSTLRVRDLKDLLPHVQAKTVRRISEALSADNAITGQRAAEALVFVGPPAVPHLVRVMDAGHPGAATRAREAAERIGEDALPEIRELVRGDDVSTSAVVLLAKFDPDAVAELESFIGSALASPDQLKARFAIDAVLSAGDRMIDLLIDLIGSSDPFAQQNATNALIELGELAVPELVDELDHPNPIVQGNAMRALREIGAPAIERLDEARKEGSVLLGQNALAVINDIGRGKGRTKSGSKGGKRRFGFRR